MASAWLSSAFPLVMETTGAQVDVCVWGCLKVTWRVTHMHSRFYVSKKATFISEATETCGFFVTAAHPILS